MSKAPASPEPTPNAPRTRLRKRLHRVAAALTHSVFLLAIALAFIRGGGTPHATVKEPALRIEEPTETPRDTAALPEALTPGGGGEAEDSSPAPDEAGRGEGEFELAQRSRRSRRERREEPPAETPAPLPTPQRSAAEQARANTLMARLVAAYPDHLTGHDDNNLIWRDGTRMGFDDGTEKTFQERLERPDIEDQFAQAYPIGEVLSDPEPDTDPGRIRNQAFFAKMYGDCRRDRNMQRSLVDVVWLPQTGGGRKIKVTPVNGVAEKLQRVSDELDSLPEDMLKFLRPIPAPFVCRDASNTSRQAAHGYGIAIDLNNTQGDYWESRGRRRGGEQPLQYRNRIPQEIVAIFEKHGFIWGGKWYHFDTAHFEYRPELLMADEQPGGGEASVPFPEKQPRNLN